MARCPAPPCDAYAAVAELLGPAYFRAPPPSQGVRVTVVGPDRAASVWDMTRQAAVLLGAKLRDDGWSWSESVYDDRGRR